MFTALPCCRRGCRFVFSPARRIRLQRSSALHPLPLLLFANRTDGQGKHQIGQQQTPNTWVLKKTQILSLIPPFFLFLFSFKSISQWAEIITNNKCPPGWINQTRALWNSIGNNDPAQHNLPKFHTHQIKWHPCKYIQYQQMTGNCYCSQRWKDTEQCENTAIISCTLSPWTGTCSSNFFLVSLNPNDSLGLVLTKCLSGNHDLSAFIKNPNLLKYDQANAASMGKT